MKITEFKKILVFVLSVLRDRNTERNIKSVNMATLRVDYFQLSI